MLSYIFRIIQDFEKEHCIRPNLIYLNRQHVTHLIEGFTDGINLQQILGFLQVDLIIDETVNHPRVSWSQTTYQRAV